MKTKDDRRDTSNDHDAADCGANQISDEERSDYQHKIELYKEQVKKMRENLDLFKDTVKTLQTKNEELEANFGSQPSLP